MRTAIVIPARYASTRLPAKPLLRETGKYLIQHVYEQALAVTAATVVIVATDDDRIRTAVESFGGRVVMTRADHPSGTDRVAEVVENLDIDAVINIQGDEPLFDPIAIDHLADLLESDQTADMATLAVPIRDGATYQNPNVVKVVCDDRGRALYFSRSPIPMVRDGLPDFAAVPSRFLQHVGIYAYRRATVLRLAKTPPHLLELTEKLEQLRVLAGGGSILVGIISSAHCGIDTPEDYAAFVQYYRETSRHRSA